MHIRFNFSFLVFICISALTLVSFSVFPSRAVADSPCPLVWEATPAPDVGFPNVLYGVAALQENDVWAVGSYTSSDGDKTLTEHWDGTKWDIIPSPNIGTANRLSSVIAFANSNAWALGETDANSFLLEWNGTVWNTIPLPEIPAIRLNTLDGTAPYNIWIGGTADGKPYVAHWDGTTWSELTPPDLDQDYTVQRVIPTSPDQAYALAWHNEGEYPFRTVRYRFLHWNGNAWAQFDEMTFTQGIHAAWFHIFDFAVVNQNDIWAVGESRDYVLGSSLYTGHWNGTAWEWHHIVPPRFATPNHIRVRAPDDVWVVG